MVSVICQLSEAAARGGGGGAWDKSCAGRHVNYERLSRHSTLPGQIEGKEECAARVGGFQN